MKNKSFETILYSTVGVAAMALILIAFNFITGSFKSRVDLTKERAYTLSAGTRAILTKLDAPVKVRFYCTQGENSTPGAIMLKNYAKEVEDLLGEYKQAAKGKLIIEKYNPEPDSDAEDSAHLDGVEGQMLGNNPFGGGDRFYLGLSVSYGMDQKVAIPFLSPERERLLEYDISRAISQVFTPEKPVVGIMSPLPIFGMPANPMMMRMGQQGEQPWTIVNELKNDFKVKRVAMDVDKIEDDVKVLLVVHPREITDKAQYAIDQFILRGGKMIAFLDPLPALIDTKEQNQMFGAIPNSGSTLDKLLKAWGINFESGKVVADMKYSLQVGGRNGQPTQAPAILGLTRQALNNDDIVTSQIDSVWLPFAGSFSGTPADGLKETVLLKSTKESQLVDGSRISSLPAPSTRWRFASPANSRPRSPMASPRKKRTKRKKTATKNPKRKLLRSSRMIRSKKANRTTPLFSLATRICFPTG
jgi:gliding motility-associatede transport system auxiliary component